MGRRGRFLSRNAPFADRHFGNVDHFIQPQGRDERRVREVREAGEQGFGEIRGFLGETPSHGHGIVEDKPAHRRPSLTKSLIVSPPSETPLRNSRIRSAAARAFFLSNLGWLSLVLHAANASSRNSSTLRYRPDWTASSTILRCSGLSSIVTRFLRLLRNFASRQGHPTD